MASLATSIVASMVIDDMLKDDSGVVTQLLEGDDYKRRRYKLKSHVKTGGVVAKVAVRQAAKQVAKQAARQVAKRVTKQAVQRIAIRGAKESGRGSAVSTVGIGADAAINRTGGGGRRRRRKGRRRKSMKGSKH